MRRITLTTLGIASLLLARDAAADAQFLTGTIAHLHDAVGNSIVYSLTESTSNNGLAWKSAAEHGWHNVLASGVVPTEDLPVVTPNSTWVGFGGTAGDRLYAVWSDGTLREWTHASQSWRNVTGTGGPSLTGTPAIAATFDAGTGRNCVWLAVRDASGHVWSGAIANGGAAATGWLDVSVHGEKSGTQLVATYSPVTIVAGATSSRSNDEVEIYGVTAPASGTGGRLVRNRIFAFDWSTAPTLSETVDYVAIRAWNPGGMAATSLVVAGWGSTTDTLATINATSSGWGTWSELLGAIGPVGVAYNPDSFDVARSGTATRIWALESFYGENLWYCDFASSACTWTKATSAGGSSGWGVPADQLPEWDVLVYVSADYNTAHLIGSVGEARYLYAYNLTSFLGVVRPEWQNHLTPLSGTVLLPTLSAYPSPGEFAAAEYDGTIVMSGQGNGGPSIANELWRSTDDGYTWTGCPGGTCPTTPFPASTRGVGDTSVAFDASGTAYVMAINQSGTNSQPMITRWDDSSGAWTFPYAIAEVPDLLDHPVMIADRTNANVLYSVQQSFNVGGGGFHGTFQFCAANGSTTSCAPSGSQTSGWCGSTVYAQLPSQFSCGQYCADTDITCVVRASGCEVAQTLDGTVWVSVEDDTACLIPTYFEWSTSVMSAKPSSYPPGYSPTNTIPHLAAVGLRHVTNTLTAGCSTTPILSGIDACLYYVQPSAAQLNNAGLSSGDGPGGYRGWSAHLTAAGDTNRLMITVRSAREVVHGNFCNTTDAACRTDLFFATIDNPLTGGTGWCGTSCSPNANLATMFPLNDDATSGWFTCSGKLCQEDHILPMGSALDNNHLLLSWMDFRASTSDTAFTLESTSWGYTSTGGWTLSGTAAWPTTTGYYQPFSDATGNYWYGDYNRQADARLHAHAFMSLTTSTSAPSIPVEHVISAFAY